MTYSRRAAAFLAIPVTALAVALGPAASALANGGTTVSSGVLTCTATWKGNNAYANCTSDDLWPDRTATFHVGCNWSPIVIADDVTPVYIGWPRGYVPGSAHVYCWQGVNDAWFTFTVNPG